MLRKRSLLSTTTDHTSFQDHSHQLDRYANLWWMMLILLCNSKFNQFRKKDGTMVYFVSWWCQLFSRFTYCWGHSRTCNASHLGNSERRFKLNHLKWCINWAWTYWNWNWSKLNRMNLTLLSLLPSGSWTSRLHFLVTFLVWDP